MILIASPIIGFITALIATITVFMGIKAASKAKDGVLKYYFYAILISSAATMLLSNRDFLHEGQYFQSAILTNPIAEWLTRFASLFTMLAALERTVNYLQHNRWDGARITMLLVLTYFWITNLFIPLFITSQGQLEIKYFYSLALSIGIALSIQNDPQDVIKHARNAIVGFVIASLAFIFIQPLSALDMNYSQGYIPGLPRLFGLAPHATSMGLFAALAIWITLAYPYGKKTTNKLVISLCFVALVLTQSKTVMVSFIIGLPFILFYLSKDFKNQHPDKTNFYQFGLYTYISGGVLLLIMALSVLLFIDYQALAYQYLGAEKIHNLVTLTGRDVIWEIALNEFHQNPIFGYGAGLFSPEFRQSIGMMNATHGHNQFIDALGRSGIIGFSGVVLLFGYMLFHSIKIAGQTKGLSLTLMTLLCLNSITEVPITLGTIGLNVLPYYLLLILISSGHTHARTKSVEPNSRTAYHV